MKLFVMAFVAASAINLLLGVNSLGMTPEQKTRFKELVAVCQKEHNVPDEDFDRLRKSQFENTSHDAKCLINCFVSKMKWIVNGVVDAEKATKDVENIYGRETFMQTIKDCSYIHDDDVCEKIFKMYKCYKKHNTAAF